MKNTRKSVIELLKTKANHLRAMENMEERDGDETWRQKYMHERWGIESAINMLEDEAYFNDIYAIYNKEGGR